MSFEPSWIHKFEVKPDSWVYVPSLATKILGEKISKQVKSVWRAPEYFYHLNQGGHVQGLKSHINDKFFSSIDISDFFGSISRSRITRALKKRLSYELAREIAMVSTVKHYKPEQHSHSLPFGYVQSPILASICLDDSALGECIKACSINEALNISVYMDDIVLSSNSKQELLEQMELLKDAARRSHFSLNVEKESPPADSVVAFNIELSHSFLKITDSRMVKFTQAYINAESEFEREGIVGYVGTVNFKQAKSLAMLQL
ncbi:reverse transcriptase domain-containing protein [Thalassotalea sp. G2M2-11]|uniref:reverse transcriptase domain-containing protein n=1 Tax=Thalassotalea sp. G2M2-11 TaxID=2787627 RepID=UPI0019D2A274|nr:reverse transcriptase domain-containing protein [Thalassotalea sp. G2M2-11]